MPHASPRLLRALFVWLAVLSRLPAAGVQQGNGIKVGEVSADTAVVWTRLTTTAEANWTGADWQPPTLPGTDPAALREATAVARESGSSAAAAKAQTAAKRKGAAADQEQLRRAVLQADPLSQLPAGLTLPAMRGALPGTAGATRVIATPADGGESIMSTWGDVDAASDHTRQVTLTGLRPGTAYRLRVESRDPAGQSGAIVEGGFRTAPAATHAAPVRFAVVTCGDYPRRDDPANGHRIYASLHQLRPDFLVHTGDVEYYDKPDPWATSAALARFKWNRLYALPFLRTFHNHTAAYFTNDDHDLLRNDCWPGQTYGRLTWEEGLAIWNEQTPVSSRPYRTFRHGRDLQVWIVEGRRYRSANSAPDGPAKTILGAEQKAWLLRTLAASDATFKVLLSPTPIVGPDRGSKNDNHANTGFRHEGDELRRALGAHRNLIVANGDRHWQYFSVDPATGLREFGCGPSSDVHAGGYSPQPGDDAVQKFFRLKGGFLTIATVPAAGGAARLEVRHHAVDGAEVHAVELDRAGKHRVLAPR
ncbi:MAG: alkaline phosphatase D family protein [Opitutaceae bacterium]